MANTTPSKQDPPGPHSPTRMQTPKASHKKTQNPKIVEQDETPTTTLPQNIASSAVSPMYIVLFCLLVVLFTAWTAFDFYLQTRIRYDLRVLELEQALRDEYQSKIQKLEERGSVPCVNDHAECQEWADAGECTNNRFFMQWYCRQACGSCNKVESMYLLGLKQKAPEEFADWHKSLEDAHVHELEFEKERVREEMALELAAMREMLEGLQTEARTTSDE